MSRGRRLSVLGELPTVASPAAERPVRVARLSRSSWLLGASILVGLGLRLALLNGRSLWFDEIFSVTLARLPWAQSLGQIAARDAHPPLYYLLLHAWLSLGESPVMARLPSALLGTLALVPTWLIAFQLGGRLLAGLATALLATSTLAIQASVEARMYPLLSVTAAWATLFLLQATARGRARDWVAYAAVLTLALYTHYFGFLVLAAHAVYVAAVYRRDLAVRQGMLLAVAGAVAAYAPWWPTAAQHVARVNPVWLGPMPPDAPLTLVALAAFGGYFRGLGGYLVHAERWGWEQLVLVGPFVGLLLVGSGTLRRRAGGALVILTWAVPILLLVGASVARGLFYAIPRYAAFLQPFFAILTAAGVVALGRRVARSRSAGVAVIAAALVAAINLASLGLALANPRYQPFDWAGAARHVQNRWRPDDGLVFYPHTARAAFAFYFARPLARATTVFPPPWAARASRAELIAGLRPLVEALDALRLWVIVTEPTPPESADALLDAIERRYAPSESADFNHVWVYLYVRR